MSTNSRKLIFYSLNRLSSASFGLSLKIVVFVENQTIWLEVILSFTANKLNLRVVSLHLIDFAQQLAISKVCAVFLLFSYHRSLGPTLDTAKLFTILCRTVIEANNDSHTR